MNYLLFLEQESDLLYKKVIKMTLQTIDPFHFKFRLQNLCLNSQNSHAKKLDIIIGENQLAAITKKTIYYTLFL